MKPSETFERSQHLLRAVIEGTTDVVYLQDLEGRYLVINPVGAQMLGMTEEEVVGQRDVDLFPPEEAKLLREENDLVIQSGEACIRSVQVTLGGKQHVFQTNKTPYRDQNGNCIGVVGVCRDITDLKNAEEAVRRNERLASIGTLAAGIAHNLNNALCPVLGFAQLLLKEPSLPDHLRSSAKAIFEGAQDAAETVKGLQRFSTLKSEQDPNEEVELDELIQQVAEITRPRWDECKIKVETRLEGPAIVYGNRSELRQVLTNLVFNSVDAMPTGGTLRFSTRAGPELHTIEVADSGEGMTAEQREHCFEPFFTTKDEGVGLGLSVCFGVVERHGGMLEITSEPAAGTTVRVSLPAATQHEDDAAREEPVEEPASSGRVILYIDDDAKPRQTVRALLEATGQTVEVAPGGEEGIELFGSRPFDVVLTDVGMSGVDGFEVARRIRAEDPQVPIIFITGWSSSDVEGRRERGVKPDYVIEKPVTMEKIQEALLAVLPQIDVSR